MDFSRITLWIEISRAGIVGCVLAIAAIVVHRLRRRRYDLDRIPTPPSYLPLLGHLLQLAVPHNHRVCLDYAVKFGPLVRVEVLGQEMVIISDPEVAEAVLGPQADLPKCKGIYDMFTFFVGGDNLLSHKDNDAEYRCVRKTVAVAFSNDSLRKQFEGVRAHTLRLVERLRAIGPQTDVNMDEWMVKLLFDVTCSSFEADMDALDHDHVPYLEAMTACLRELSACEINLFRRLLLLFMPCSTVARAYEKNHAELRKVQTELLKRLVGMRHDDTDRSMGAQLTRLKDYRTGEQLSLEALGPYFNGLFLGAFETTSHTSAWALMEIAAHPDVQAKLQRELDDYGLLATPTRPRRVELKYEHLNQLTYLNQALKEAMRLHPVAAAGTARVAPAPMRVGPYMVPEGTQLLVSLYALHWSPHNYTRPEEFLPERWGKNEDAFDEQQKPMYPDATLRGNVRALDKSYLNFSYGPRSCPGVNMAYMQARIVLATVLSNFRLELAPGVTRDHLRQEQIISLTLQPGGKAILLRCHPLVDH